MVLRFCVVLLVLLLQAGAWAQAFPFRALKEGDEIPQVEVVDINTGKRLDVKKATSRGVSVLVFWGADSKYKRKHSVKVLKGIIEASRDMGTFKVYPINVQTDEPEVVKEVLEETGYQGPAWVDEGRRLYKAFGIFVMPCVAIVKDGRVYKGFGYTHKLVELVKGYVQVALGEKTEEELQAELNPKQVEKSPQEKEALRYYRLGVSMVAKGMYDRAEEAFSKALSVKKDYEAAKLGLAVVYAVKGEASKLKEMLSGETGGDYRWKVLEVKLLLLEGKVDEALQEATSLMFTKPKCPHVFVLLGDIYSEKGDWEKACKYYRKALERCYNLGGLLTE